MPTGKVKWYDTEKAFGFVTSDEGEDVFVHVSALPEGTTALKPGQRIEFGIAQGRRGNQALSVRLLEAPPSLAKAARRDPDDLVPIVEDLIRLLDGVGGALRRGRYPDKASGAKVAAVLRAVAEDLDA
ncbi:putative cold-shock DNA-binding protein [Motilibacter rhizosphaerae]|uniref:Putative cold-shock DNA-binding protein n=1 Tax=Motilibacter rhizosphaerae TaxID=598652 RepID=A0A4Q7NQC2_9ACTN|nr:cold-shock protein [Motilibacter rhizosphaerae]RZS87534.1 putative cold-shock DNA-binding protein [Motilibacter rhizosphaerae]